MSELPFAEARITIIPDTTAFRARLIAEVEAAVQAASKAAVVSVGTGAAGGVSAATAASQQKAAAAASANRAQVRLTTRAQELYTAALDKTAVAQAEVSDASGALNAAHIRATQATRAHAAAEKALEAAIAAGDAALQVQAQTLVETTALQSASAVSALRNVKAQEALAVSAARAARTQASLAKGFGATGLAAAGARGATLAASGTFLAGAAAAVGLFKSVTAAASLQQELHIFAASAGATADQLEEVRKEAVGLGNDITLPGVNAGGAAKAMTTLAKAGLGVQDSMDAARGTLQLATAAELDQADAANIVASSLNAFQLSGKDAAQVADLLANASVEAQGSAGDMGIALEQTALAAKTVGLTLPSTVALLTQLAQAGLQGSKGGTTLRVALLRLVNPPKQARDALELLFGSLKKANSEIKDFQGNVRPDAFVNIQRAADRLSASQRQQALAALFGFRAIQAQSALGRSTAEDLEQLTAKVELLGGAQVLSAARTEGFSGKVEGLKNALDTLGITIGQVVVPALGLVAQGATQNVHALTSLIAGAESLGSRLAHPFVVATAAALDLGDRGGNAVQGFLDKVHHGLGSFIFEGTPGERSFFGFPPADKVVADATKITEAVQKILDAGNKTGGVQGLNDVSVALQDIIAGLASAGPKGREFAAVLQQVLNEIQKTGNLPAHFDLRLELKFLNLQDELNKKRKEVEDAFRNAFVKPFDVTAKAKISLDTQFSLAGVLGTPGQQLDIARQSREKARNSLLALLGLPKDTTDAALLAATETRRLGKSRAAAVDKAAAALSQADSEIESITGKQASEAQQHAAKAKSAAEKAARARAKATQAFVDSFGGREQQLENRITTDQTNEQIGREIADTNRLIRFHQREIREFKRRIRSMHLHGDALKIARDAIAAINQKIFTEQNEIDRLTKERTKNRQTAAQATADARQQHLEALLSIAETTKRTTDDAKRLRALIAFDKAQIKRINHIKSQRKLTREETAQLDAYRVDQAQREQALRELTDQEKKTNAAAQAQFEFLQAQAGFAANLLGNLIPLGASGGLVGGTSGGSLATPSVTSFSTAVAPPEKGAAIATGLQSHAARAEGRNIGPTRIGQSRELTLLHQILNTLRGIHARSTHPEAQTRRAMNRDSMDITVPGV